MNSLLLFMHDTMGDTARIKASIKLIKQKEEKKNLSHEEMTKLLDIIEISNDRLTKTIDQYYITNKNKTL